MNKRDEDWLKTLKIKIDDDQKQTRGQKMIKWKKEKISLICFNIKQREKKVFEKFHGMDIKKVLDLNCQKKKQWKHFLIIFKKYLIYWIKMIHWVFIIWLSILKNNR